MRQALWSLERRRRASDDPDVHAHGHVDKIQPPAPDAADAQDLQMAVTTPPTRAGANVPSSRLAEGRRARVGPLPITRTGWRMASRPTPRIGDRGPGRTPAFEVDGVDDALLGEFSQRSTQVTARTRELAESFRVEHGRCPSRVERTRLAQRACRDTRPTKAPHALADLLADWRHRARVHTGRSPHDLASRGHGRPDGPATAGR